MFLLTNVTKLYKHIKPISFLFLNYSTCLCDRVILYFVLDQKLWPLCNFHDQKKEVGSPEHTHGESVSPYDKKKTTTKNHLAFPTYNNSNTRVFKTLIIRKLTIIYSPNRPIKRSFSPKAR